MTAGGFQRKKPSRETGKSELPESYREGKKHRSAHRRSRPSAFEKHRNRHTHDTQRRCQNIEHHREEHHEPELHAPSRVGVEQPGDDPATRPQRIPLQIATITSRRTTSGALLPSPGLHRHGADKERERSIFGVAGRAGDTGIRRRATTFQSPSSKALITRARGGTPCKGSH